MEIKAVIFDMDGVIFNTEAISYAVWQTANHKFNLNLDHKMILSLMNMSHETIHAKYRQLFKPELAAIIHEYRHSTIRQFIKAGCISVKPGVREIFDYLQQNVIPIALATSSGSQQVDLCFSITGLQRPFKIILNGDMVSRRKPDPEIYIKTIEGLDISTQECVIIEDSTKGFLAGQAAGIRTILIPDIQILTQEALDQAFAVKKDLFEVIQLIREINQDDKEGSSILK